MNPLQQTMEYKVATLPAQKLAYSNKFLPPPPPSFSLISHIFLIESLLIQELLIN
jgi:hypothetical protein